MDGGVNPWPGEVAASSLLAGREGGSNAMRCPSCGYENFIGADLCDNCGADLGGRDVPEPATSFHGRLMGEHLDELAAGAPLAVAPDTTLDVVIGRMSDSGTDCALVMDGERLVGIFTDRDAVVKVTGLPLRDHRVDEFMTPDPVVLRDDDTIAVAIHKMAVGGFRHIPFTRNGQPTGVVTARDVFHHLATIIG